MEATVPGANRTGAASNPAGIDAMLEAVRSLSPPTRISTLLIDLERQRYIVAADSVGSIPPNKSASQLSLTDASSIDDTGLSVFLDKLGERIAFERTGTRLYDALLSKCLALANVGGETLPLSESLAELERPETTALEQSEHPLETLTRIRSQEHAHLRMLCECVRTLGGDPTAQTPCADVAATASMGLMQVMTDPRTTLAQCLNTLLTAELTDNAGWDLLGKLAESMGLTNLLEPFSQALEAEKEHLFIIRGWLTVLTTRAPGTLAV